MLPGPAQGNLSDNLHGGATLTFIDIALFAGARACGVDLGDVPVTVDLSCQFVGAGAIGVPTFAEVEVVRETRRLVFVRGLVVQRPESDSGDERMIASFAGIVRKGRRPDGTAGA
jgi:acyl-coenzyme A thioesterase PaaI-like protein